MKTLNDLNLKMRPFDVNIPNLEGDGIAETFTIQVPVTVDSVTGEEVLAPEALELIEKTKARRLGLMSPCEIRDLRERLDFTQEDMSDLLQIGAKTYTRWESGRARVSRSMNVLLSALRDGVITVEYLRCLREGRDWSPLIERLRRKNVISFYGDIHETEPSREERPTELQAALKCGQPFASQPELGFKACTRALRVLDSAEEMLESSRAA